MMSKTKKTILLFAAALLLGSALGVVGFFAWQSYSHSQVPQATSTPAPTPTPTPSPTPTPIPTPTPTPTPSPTPEPYNPPEDLLKYREQNPHVIALLDIPGTNIHYPILLHPTEDNYYLNITIDGYAGYPGSIYINLAEGQDFDTFNTVIYGHNMSDGSMFGTLNQYDNTEYMKQHREIHIYTMTEEHVYKVCAIVIYDDRYITYTYNDSVEADREAYLRSLQGGTWLDDVEVTTSSHIITLSTCIGGMPENRRLLIAVEQEEPPVQGTDMVIVLPEDEANTGLPYGIN